MMSKVISTIWISTLSGKIGIVMTDNGFEKEAFIGKISGFDEKADADSVAMFGGKLLLHHAREIVTHLLKSKSNNKEPFGKEWEFELMNMTKKQIILLLKDACKRAIELKDELNKE